MARTSVRRSSSRISPRTRGRFTMPAQGGVGTRRTAALLAAFGVSEVSSSVDAMDAVRLAHSALGEDTRRRDWHVASEGGREGGRTGLRSDASQEHFMPVPESRALAVDVSEADQPSARQSVYFCSSCRPGASFCQRCLGYETDRAKQARPAAVLRQRQIELKQHTSRRVAKRDDDGVSHVKVAQAQKEPAVSRPTG
jgi:hypothetical protein